jgi:hypothetical protein
MSVRFLSRVRARCTDTPMRKLKILVSPGPSAQHLALHTRRLVLNLGAFIRPRAVVHHKAALDRTCRTERNHEAAFQASSAEFVGEFWFR